MATTHIVTADGVRLETGARAFNHYDMKPGLIDRIDSHPQPDTMRGQTSATPFGEWDNYWFVFRHEDGTSTSLDGSRICSITYAQRKGWMKPI